MVADIKTTLGISLEQTSLERYRCEVEKLAKWCLSQTEVISATGKFDPCRVVPHDTTCTITLLAGDPRLQARPDKTSPQWTLQQWLLTILDKGLLRSRVPLGLQIVW